MGEIGSGNGTSYPTALDTDTSIEVDSPSAGATLARAAVPNDLAAAIIAIETELGLLPKGAYASIRAKLDDMCALTGNQTVAGIKTFSSAPIITPLTGILKGNGASAVSVAAAGTDYAAATGITGSTNGNKTRWAVVAVTGQTGNQIKCQMDNTAGFRFNASGIMDTTLSAAFGTSGNATVGSGATAITYDLNAAGTQLGITFSEAVTCCRAFTVYQTYATDAVSRASVSGTKMVLQIINPAGGAAINWATGLGAGTTQIYVCFEIIVGGAA